MIAMLDRDRSGKMGFNEFKELWTALNQWKVKELRKWKCTSLKSTSFKSTSLLGNI